MNKQDKKQVVEKLTKDFTQAKSLSFIDFAGLNIVAQQTLKKELKKVQAKMLVAKNTLIKLALRDSKQPKEAEGEGILSGQTAVVLGTDDPISPIQVIGKAAGQNESIKFKAGVLEGVFQDKESLIAISKLPGKDTLVGQVVANIASPMYMLVSNLQAGVQELLATLSAKVG